MHRWLRLSAGILILPVELLMREYGIPSIVASLTHGHYAAAQVSRSGAWYRRPAGRRLMNSRSRLGLPLALHLAGTYLALLSHAGTHSLNTGGAGQRGFPQALAELTRGQRCRDTVQRTWSFFGRTSATGPKRGDAVLLSCYAPATQCRPPARILSS